MSLSLITAIFTTHFVADFIFQSDWMAMNKSKRNWPLLVHVAVYGACFLWLGPLYALINAAIHFIVDFITSRATSYLWAKQQRHWFFVVIGFDQLVHQITLLFTLSFAWQWWIP